MEFKRNVKANYLNVTYLQKSILELKKLLSISDNVRIDHVKGNLIADKLLFDITSKKLDITFSKRQSKC